MSKTNVRLERCEHCNSVISQREIVIFKSLIFALWQVYYRCVNTRNNEFTMRDVRHLLGRNEYARFGDLVLFGDLVYKIKKSCYGLNMQRCDEFFAGDIAIPIRILKDPVSGEVMTLEYGTIDKIPKLKSLLDDNFAYIVHYQKR